MMSLMPPKPRSGGDLKLASDDEDYEVEEISLEDEEEIVEVVVGGEEYIIEEVTIDGDEDDEWIEYELPDKITPILPCQRSSLFEAPDLDTLDEASVETSSVRSTASSSVRSAGPSSIRGHVKCIKINSQYHHEYFKTSLGGIQEASVSTNQEAVVSTHQGAGVSTHQEATPSSSSVLRRKADEAGPPTPPSLPPNDQGRIPTEIALETNDDREEDPRWRDGNTNKSRSTTNSKRATNATTVPAAAATNKSSFSSITPPTSPGGGVLRSRSTTTSLLSAPSSSFSSPQELSRQPDAPKRTLTPVPWALQGKDKMRKKRPARLVRRKPIEQSEEFQVPEGLSTAAGQNDTNEPDQLRPVPKGFDDDAISRITNAALMLVSLSPKRSVSSCKDGVHRSPSNRSTHSEGTYTTVPTSSFSGSTDGGSSCGSSDISMLLPDRLDCQSTAPARSPTDTVRRRSSRSSSSSHGNGYPSESSSLPVPKSSSRTSCLSTSPSPRKAPPGRRQPRLDENEEGKQKGSQGCSHVSADCAASRSQPESRHCRIMSGARQGGSSERSTISRSHSPSSGRLRDEISPSISSLGRKMGDTTTSELRGKETTSRCHPEGHQLEEDDERKLTFSSKQRTCNSPRRPRHCIKRFDAPREDEQEKNRHPPLPYVSVRTPVSLAGKSSRDSSDASESNPCGDEDDTSTKVSARNGSGGCRNLSHSSNQAIRDAALDDNGLTAEERRAGEAQRASSRLRPDVGGSYDGEPNSTKCPDRRSKRDEEEIVKEPRLQYNQIVKQEESIGKSQDRGRHSIATEQDSTMPSSNSTSFDDILLEAHSEHRNKNRKNPTLDDWLANIPSVKGSNGRQGTDAKSTVSALVRRFRTSGETNNRKGDDNKDDRDCRSLASKIGARSGTPLRTSRKGHDGGDDDDDEDGSFVSSASLRRKAILWRLTGRDKVRTKETPSSKDHDNKDSDMEPSRSLSKDERIVDRESKANKHHTPGELVGVSAERKKQSWWNLGETHRVEGGHREVLPDSSNPGKLHQTPAQDQCQPMHHSNEKPSVERATKVKKHNVFEDLAGASPGNRKKSWWSLGKKSHKVDYRQGVSPDARNIGEVQKTQLAQDETQPVDHSKGNDADKAVPLGSDSEVASSRDTKAAATTNRKASANSSSSKNDDDEEVPNLPSPAMRSMDPPQSPQKGRRTHHQSRSEFSSPVVPASPRCSKNSVARRLCLAESGAVAILDTVGSSPPTRRSSRAAELSPSSSMSPKRPFVDGSSPRRRRQSITESAAASAAASAGGPNAEAGRTGTANRSPVIVVEPPLTSALLLASAPPDGRRPTATASTKAAGTTALERLRELETIQSLLTREEYADKRKEILASI